MAIAIERSTMRPFWSVDTATLPGAESDYLVIRKNPTEATRVRNLYEAADINSQPYERVLKIDSEQVAQTTQAERDAYDAARAAEESAAKDAAATALEVDSVVVAKGIGKLLVAKGVCTLQEVKDSIRAEM